MSINFCTINSETIDSFCGVQRSKVLNRLLLLKYGPIVNPPTPAPAPTPGSGGGTVRPGTPGTWNNYQQPDKFVPPVIGTERDRIIVSVELKSENLRGFDEQKVLPNSDVVVVTNVKIEPIDLGVNISMLSINKD